MIRDVALLASLPVFPPRLLAEGAAASAAGAALTPPGPRATPLLRGSTGHPAVPAHRQRDQPPRKVPCPSAALGSPQGTPELLSPARGSCSPVQVQPGGDPSQHEATPVCISSQPTSPAKPPSAGCYRSSAGITCAAKSHLFFLYIFALPGRISTRNAELPCPHRKAGGLCWQPEPSPTSPSPPASTFRDREQVYTFTSRPGLSRDCQLYCTVLNYVVVL